MAKQTDLRVIRTRQMIRDAFFELMETSGFAGITVDGLAKKAFISRNTFYLHYSDKFDLLNKLEDEVLLGLKDIMDRLDPEVIKTQAFGDDRSLTVLRWIFAYIQKNRRFFTLIMGENGDPAFLQKLGETIEGVFMSKIDANSLAIHQRYFIAVIIGIQTSIIRQWLRSGMRETPEELSAVLAEAFRSVPKDMPGG